MKIAFMQFRYTFDEAMGCDMAFILGVIFFVVVVGLLDARLPWPAPRSRGSQP